MGFLNGAERDVAGILAVVAATVHEGATAFFGCSRRGGELQ
jgi:hypothetical protein